ncbi:hypothetical protein [Limosilactobacillus fermentum]|uniref:hypothetical protein n=1 Tax=Limosilactobacillus fermentum TaxID=1613 RepID=UPI0006526FFB|nr:hypothetical protein [Limosilactobacillus fermentum]
MPVGSAKLPAQSTQLQAGRRFFLNQFLSIWASSPWFQSSGLTQLAAGKNFPRASLEGLGGPEEGTQRMS